MSDDPSKIKDIDLEIFKDKISKCIKPTDHESVITELCSNCKRLCVASKYYDMLCATNLDEQKRKALLMEFMETVYQSVLDDTAHFIKEHSEDLQRVWKEWTERYGFAKCTVSQCAKTARHYGRGRRNVQKEKMNVTEEDAFYIFYQSLFDSFHNFVAHLYQIGLRVDTEALLKSGSNEKKDGNVSGLTDDTVFAAKRDHINARRKECHVDLEQFNDENNKFTIQSSEKKTQNTLFDAVLDKVMETVGCDREVVNRLKEYLKSSQFDSEGLLEDLKEVTDSNVANLVQNANLCEIMKAYIGSIQLRRNAFSTGFVFDYWLEGQSMSIKPKYKNLKEEIIESGYLTLARWKCVVVKARRYLKTKKVKKAKSGRAKTRDKRRGNTDQKSMSLEHLCAIILYCDFTVLCTAFSATYRLQDVFEELESLKRRHSAFAHFGRLLAEAVLRFGINGCERTKGYERGPYYCGLNYPLNFGTYAIHLLGPCSTSTQMMVALNFAKSKGILLTLNNDGFESQNQCFFDCSWISNYFEEDERLWIACEKALRIESIAIVENAKNYRKLVHSLYAFDAMISGVDMFTDKMDLNKNDFKLISKLFEVTLGGGDVVLSDLDSYLTDEWALFRQNRKEIKIDFRDLRRKFKILSKLIVYKVVSFLNRGDQSPKGMENVLKPEWISLFPSVHTVRIRAVYYECRLEALLETVKSLSPLVTVIVEDRRVWAKQILTDKISAVFKAEGWNIEYDDEHVGFKYESKGGLIIKSCEQ